MRKQGTGNMEQETVRLLRQTLPPMDDDAGASRDLWPEMERRLRAEAMPEAAKMHVPWVDWALGLGLAGLLAMFPAWIPVLLYCL